MDKQKLGEALSILDRASAKAHLTREEHVVVQNALALISSFIEETEKNKQAEKNG